MVSQVANALVRGILVALLVVAPAMLLPNPVGQTPITTALVAFFLGLLIFVEYATTAPSLVEFRDAPPYNRFRFLSLLVIVFSMSGVYRSQTEDTPITEFLYSLGRFVSAVTDSMLSPVRSLMIALPENTPEATRDIISAAAGLGMLISIVMLITFVFIFLRYHWPGKSGSFNVWVNMPVFDPTAGGDVVRRLRRGSMVNLLFAILVPFSLPTFGLSVTGNIGDPSKLTPETLVWCLAIWAYMPVNLLMRAMALSKVASLIVAQREAETYREQALQPA